MIGLVGGIVGGVLGVMGGLIGTYFSIKNTNGPRERAFAIRASAACWLLVTAFLATLFVLPAAWRPAAWLVYPLILILGIRRWNAGQARALAEDEAARPGHPTATG